MTTNSVSDWIKKLPPQVRHFVAAFLGALITFIVGYWQVKGTLSGLFDQKTVLEALGAAVTAGVATLGLFAGTPLTDAYGVGSGRKTVVDTEPVPEGEPGVEYGEWYEYSPEEEDDPTIEEEVI